MSRFQAPGRRLLGSAGGWLLFAFSFAGLYQAAAVVSGLGGFCARGGPYVIATECPDSVVVFAPAGIFGMLVGVGIAAWLARGFGMPLIVWAWPVLFVGLGIQFFTGIAPDLESIIMGVLLGAVFVVMGLVPLWIALKSETVRAFVGDRNLLGQPFGFDPPRHPRTFGGLGLGIGRGRGDDEEPAPVRAADWVIALGTAGAASAAGVRLSVLAFNALATA